MKTLIPDDVQWVDESMNQKLAPILSSDPQTQRCVLSDHGNVLEVKVPIGSHRSQDVFIGQRVNDAGVHMLWCYTLCGMLRSHTDCRPFLSLNVSLDGCVMTLLKFGGTEFIAAVGSLKLVEGWEQQLADLIIQLAHDGDQLEDQFWAEDRY